MILTQAQAVACVYAMDTSDLCVHLTIGADIDVQKLPSGCVSVEGRHGSEHYSNVHGFIAAYDLPYPAHPLECVRAELQSRQDAASVESKFWRSVGAVAFVGVLVLVGVTCF